MSGSVDVSNLHTDKDKSRQEVVKSTQNLFTAAVKSLSVQPSLKKVIIMKQISVDPLSLKLALSQVFNSTLTGI